MKYGALFVLTCLVATAVGWAQDLPKASDPQDGIPFELNPKFGSILIKAQVNRRPAKLVVDTGSSHTILSSELLGVSTGSNLPANIVFNGFSCKLVL